MTKLCDICGREMVLDECTWSDELQKYTFERWECVSTPDQHKIAELKKKLASALEQCEAIRGAERAANEQAERDRDRATELERELEEAKAELNTIKRRAKDIYLALVHFGKHEWAGDFAEEANCHFDPEQGYPCTCCLQDYIQENEDILRLEIAEEA